MVQPFGQKDRAVFVDWGSAIMDNLADCLVALEKTEEAEELYRRAIALGDKFWSPMAKIDLASFLSDRSENVEALQLLRSVLAIRPNDEDDFNVWQQAWRAQYDLVEEQGAGKSDLVALVQKADSIIHQARQRLGSHHKLVADMLVNCGRCLLELHEFEKAQLRLVECRDIRLKVFRTDGWQCANAEALLGECLLGLERHAEAEPLLVSGYSNLSVAVGPKNEKTMRTLRALVRLYEALEKPDKVDEYSKLLNVDS
jgi:tetratricopeptide (TPR) repeat protein